MSHSWEAALLYAFYQAELEASDLPPASDVVVYMNCDWPGNDPMVKENCTKLVKKIKAKYEELRREFLRVKADHNDFRSDEGYRLALDMANEALARKITGEITSGTR